MSHSNSRYFLSSSPTFTFYVIRIFLARCQVSINCPCSISFAVHNAPKKESRFCLAFSFWGQMNNIFAFQLLYFRQIDAISLAKSCNFSQEYHAFLGVKKNCEKKKFYNILHNTIKMLEQKRMRDFSLWKALGNFQFWPILTKTCRRSKSQKAFPSKNVFDSVWMWKFSTNTCGVHRQLPISNNFQFFTFNNTFFVRMIRTFFS